MNSLCPICLTRRAVGGYLSLLFPLLMERGPTGIERRAPESRDSGPQREAKRTILTRLRGIRGKVGAALIALAGAGAAADKSNAATMMIPGEMAVEDDFTKDYIVPVWNHDAFYYDFGNSQTPWNPERTLTWFSVRSPNYWLERYLDTGNGSNPTYTMVQPDLLNDNVRSQFLLAVSDLPEGQGLSFSFKTCDSPNGSCAGSHGPPFNYFLQNAEVYAGYGLLTGSPQTPEEAVAMTDGPVLHGQYPAVVNPLDAALLFRNIDPVPPVPGDYNGNGAVDGADYDLWRAQFGSGAGSGATLPPPPNADGNGDGVVDAADYVVWRDHLSASGAGAALAKETGGAPEPGTLTLAGAGLAGIGLASRRRLRAALGRRA